MPIVVTFFFEGIFEDVQAFLESDTIWVKEGIWSGLDDLFVFELLFFVEGGQFSLIVDDLFGVLFVWFLLFFDTEGQVGELKILFLQPVYDLYIVVALTGGLVFL